MAKVNIHFSEVEFEIPEILRGKEAHEIREIAWFDMLESSETFNQHKLDDLFRSVFGKVQDPDHWKNPIWVQTESEDHALIVAVIISWFHGSQCSINRSQVISAGYSC